MTGKHRKVLGRCERIRTSDPFVPNEVRYQAAPHTENNEARKLYQKPAVEPTVHPALLKRYINDPAQRTSNWLNRLRAMTMPISISNRRMGRKGLRSTELIPRLDELVHLLA